MRLSAETAKVWQEIAQRGQGKYFAIAQGGGVETIKTPYDERLSELGRDIGGTYMAYGSEDAKAQGVATLSEVESKMTASNTAAPTRADRALNKAMNKDAYKNDLLQDIENGKANIESVNRKTGRRSPGDGYAGPGRGGKKGISTERNPRGDP